MVSSYALQNGGTTCLTCLCNLPLKLLPIARWLHLDKLFSFLGSVFWMIIPLASGLYDVPVPRLSGNFCCKNVPQSLKGKLQVGLMPFIEGVGDEVVCVAVFAASVVLIFRSSLGYHSVNLGRLGVNVIRRCFQKTWNCISAFCSSNNMDSSRATSSEQEGFLTGMDSPPENDCCSVCHDNFDLPCQANCAHWFCGECILRVWHHSSALQPCKCPICRRPINLLIPCESATQRRDEPAVDSVLQNIEKYNRIFGGGSVGFFQRLRDTPLLLRRLLRELMDPQRALPLVFRARIVCFLALLAVYVFSPVDILPEGILGIVGLLDDVLVILVVFFHVATLYRSALFSRHGGRS